MLKFRSFAVTMSVLLVASPPPLAASDGHAAATSQAMLDALHEVSGVPGFGAAVWQDGGTVWIGSTGMRDRERSLPVEIDTRFRLASVSKLFAATALAKLAEEGRIDLDAPIAESLPWLDNAWPPITPRQLAAHTSGLPHYQAADSERGGIHYANGREAVEIFAKRPLLAPPGEDYSYSSWGYTLLGAIAEELTGKSFPALVEKAIAPGLDIGADATDSGDPTASVAYEFVDAVPARAAPHDFSYTWGGGGLMASAAGLARFGGAMLENRIVSRETFDSMVEPTVLNSGEVATDADYTVGFGWRAANSIENEPIVFHNGVTIGARSSLVLWREEGTAATILSNARWTSSIESTSQMLAAPFRRKPDGLVEADCPVSVRRFSGTLGGNSVAGLVHFQKKDGICQGTLELTGGFRDYFGQGPQPVNGRIQIIGIDNEGGLSRAGFVTPYGIYDLRAAQGGRFRATLSRTRQLDIAFGD